ncbi:MAG: hypothetical protein ACOH2V_00770 [Candidatus Saccharimonadaceae bacterium]
MEEVVMQISLSKAIELIRMEERQNIRKFFMDILGKPTADMLDSYVPGESEIAKLLTSK